MPQKVTLENVGLVIEHYVNLREQRLALQKEVAKLEEQEQSHKREIERVLKDANVEAANGKFHRATIIPDLKPTVEDWPMLYNYIRTTGYFDLLQRRVTETAAKLRWGEGIKIPGIVAFPVTKLSITKV